MGIAQTILEVIKNNMLQCNDHVLRMEETDCLTEY
jgi:hypothetical protein